MLYAVSDEHLNKYELFLLTTVCLVCVELSFNSLKVSNIGICTLGFSGAFPIILKECVESVNYIDSALLILLLVEQHVEYIFPPQKVYISRCVCFSVG